MRIGCKSSLSDQSGSRGKDLGSQLSRDEALKDNPTKKSATIRFFELSVAASKHKKSRNCTVLLLIFQNEYGVKM